MDRNAQASTFQQRLNELKAKVADLQDQVKGVRRHLDRAADRVVLTGHAVVDLSRCTACGICEQLCPQGAVHVSDVARVDVSRCTGCGTCVQYCPQGAIRLSAVR